MEQNCKVAKTFDKRSASCGDQYTDREIVPKTPRHKFNKKDLGPTNTVQGPAQRTIPQTAT
jgi:hypothetical protein